MKRIIAVFCAIACIEAEACTCESDRTPEIAFGHSKAVFVGRVVRVEPVREKKDSLFKRVECVLEIMDSMKGENLAFSSGSRRYFRVHTGIGGGDCGFSFEVGRAYLVYAYGEAELQTDICTPTKAFRSEAISELEVLRRLSKQK
jgi:hypothetical protein